MDSLIRLQFVLGPDWSSRLIAWYGTGYGGYSHVDAVLKDGTLLGARSDTAGGQPPGVQIRPANYEKWVRQDRVELAVTPADAAEWERYLRTQVGCPYDKQGILGFILGEKRHTPGYWICSALQTDALEHIHRIAPLPVPPQQVTPDALLLVVSTAGARASQDRQAA